jgi:DNA-binding NtrC family response regulator
MGDAGQGEVVVPLPTTAERSEIREGIQWEEFKRMIDSITQGKYQALVIHDEPYVRDFMCEVLRGDGWNVSQSSLANDAVERLYEASWAVVFCDMKLAGANGFSALRKFKLKLPQAKVVLMSGNANVATTLDATAFGAYDYLLRRFGSEELQSLSQLLLEQLLNRRPGTSPARRTAACHSDIDLVGRSQAFIELMKYVARASKTNLPVLLTGESGTGKKLVASAIHDRSERAHRPFVVLNCGSIPAELVESELFGHARGSFAGADRDRPGLWAQADGGTLFLDNVTETNPTFQTKLLRAVQMGEIRRAGANETTSVDVRVIAASNRDVERDVAAGRFRSDLLNGLKAVHILLPPLRERPEDIPPLAQTFAERVYSFNQPVKFSAEAFALLERYNWPGNIRELEDVVLRAAAMSDGTIRARDLPQRVRQHSDNTFAPEKTNGAADENEAWVPLSEIEGRYVARVLEHTRGNKQAAARVLCVDRKTLDRMIKRHHIETTSLRSRAKPAAAANSMSPRRQAQITRILD